MMTRSDFVNAVTKEVEEYEGMADMDVIDQVGFMLDSGAISMDMTVGHAATIVATTVGFA